MTVIWMMTANAALRLCVFNDMRTRSRTCQFLELLRVVQVPCTSHQVTSESVAAPNSRGRGGPGVVALVRLAFFCTVRLTSTHVLSPPTFFSLCRECQRRKNSSVVTNVTKEFSAQGLLPGMSLFSRFSPTVDRGKTKQDLTSKHHRILHHRSFGMFIS